MISVIIPIYNTEKFLVKCIESVLGQTYKDLEVILVNDGSTDGSLDICRHYENADKRVKVISQLNQGISVARNVALEVAKGELIACVDSDDFLEANMYEFLLSVMEKYGADTVACNYRKVDEEGKPLKPDEEEKKPGKVFVWDSKEAVMQLCEGKYATRLTVANGKIYRRELFEGVRYPAGKVHEDESTTYKLLDRSKKVAFYEGTLYNYTQRQGSIMSDIANVKLSVFDKTEALLERVQYFSDNADREFMELLVRRYFEEYLKVLRLYVKAKGRTKEARVQIKLYKQMLQRYGEYINRDTTITFGKKYRDVRKNMWKTQVKKVAKKILHK